MEIRIDTTKDDVEHIKHMITFLQNFVNNNSSSSSHGSAVNTTQQTASSDGMFGMFGTETKAPVQETPTTNSQEGIFGLFGDQAANSVSQAGSGTQQPTNTPNHLYGGAERLLDESSDILEEHDDLENQEPKNNKIEIIPY